MISGYFCGKQQPNLSVQVKLNVYTLKHRHTAHDLNAPELSCECLTQFFAGWDYCLEPLTI